MGYTPELIENLLELEHDPDAEYLIVTHQGAAVKLASDPTLFEVGTVPDSTTDQDGTMVVLQRIKPKKSSSEGSPK